MTGTFAGSIKIYGGTVDATGGDGSAGIGSGCYGKGGITTIYGGVVNATGGYQAAGIGDGYQPESSGTTAIYGGVVTASADSGVGINGTTILSWSSLTDSITASSYSGTVTTIFGKIFTVNNSETTYHGELNNDSIGGKTLVPAENAYLAELIDVELAKLSPDNFTVWSKSIALTAGKTVTVTVIPSEGYNGTMTVTDAEGNNVSVTEKGGNKFDFTMPASIASIKAGTTLKNYPITYNLNMGSVSGNPESYTIESNAITLNNPTRNGYNFNGWTGTGLDGKTQNVVIPTGSTGERSYTANWTPITYTVSYNLDGGTVSGNPTSYTIETATFTLKNPTKTGYTFAGWTGTGLDKITKTLTVKEGSTGKKTFTANWVRLKGSLANGVIKTAYSSNITVDGYKAAPYNWSIANLPDGLEFETDGHTAVVSGKPTRAGTYKVKITAKDANKLALSKTFTVKITQPAITGTFSENGSVGQNYIGSATVSGGTAPYTWTYSGVPAGLSVDISGAKISLSGKPTTAKSYNFKVTAKDKNKVSVSKTFTTKVTKPAITGTFGAGTVGVEYSGSAKVSGGTAPYTWSIRGVPAGLDFEMSSNTVKLSGKPETAGTFSMKLTAKDASGLSVSKTFKVNYPRL